MITIIRKGVKGTMKVKSTIELVHGDYITGGETRGYVSRKGIGFNVTSLGHIIKPSDEGFINGVLPRKIIFPAI
jgi:hypothetical protein